MRWSSPLWALVHFQFRSGVRVAFRAMVPLAVAFTAGSVWMGNPLFLLAPISLALFPAQASLLSALLAAGLTSAAAAGLAPRTARGMAGWINHLPVSGDQRRRAAVIGLVVALAPFFVLVAGAAIPAFRSGPEITIVRLAAIPLLAAGSSLGALPIRRRARVLALIAAASAWIGHWWSIPPALALAWAADRLAGELRPFSTRKRPWSRRFLLHAPIAPYLRITLRAMGRRLATPAVVAAAVAVPALLFITNNQLTAAQELLAVRLASLMAVVLSAALAAESLSVRRPPWPWLRSLPFSAARRVLIDAVLFAMLGLPALLISCTHPAAALPVGAVVPFLVLRAASGVRKAPGRQSGASGNVLAEGTIAAMAVALLPWAALICLILTPLALRWAVEDERRQDVSSWHELQHLAAGDPAAWSDA